MSDATSVEETPDDLTTIVDAKCLSVMASRERADRLHAGDARPDKGAHAPRPFGCADNRSLVVEAIGAAG